MKERPILYSDPMVRAVLDGTKTKTRRIIPLQPRHPINNASFVYHGGLWYYPNVCPDIHFKCRYGEPGDYLWVRETHAFRDYNSYILKKSNSVIYRADYDNPKKCARRFKPSIHMPRWASRITLEIKNITIERLWEITEEDAKKEGCRPMDYATGREVLFDDKMGSYRWHFRELWKSINGPNSWDSNPFVFVIEFERIKP